MLHARSRLLTITPMRVYWVMAALFVLGTLGRAEEARPEQVVVLANRNVPESLDLARYYVKVRGIPEANLCVLDLPAGESISRGFYEIRLRDPLLKFMREQNLIEQVERDPKTIGPHETAWATLSAKIKYVVSMYGVPLRIGDTKPLVVTGLTDRLGTLNGKNMAAVDSELALLLSPGYRVQGSVSNPMFDQVFWSEKEPVAYPFLVAARLDGPDPGTVRRMIDDGLKVERYGIQGRGYFDARGIKPGAYYAGDYWIREAYERFCREGYECQLDLSEWLWGEGYPMEDAAVYMGWYTEDVQGPFCRADFKFKPGALAYHLHSGSAKSIRTTDKYWAGPLLNKGAAFTMGAVSEPFLTLTPHLDVFASRLCDGNGFGLSAYMAIPVVSWQVTVIGDPLVRPFKLTLDQQIKNLEEDNQKDVEWAYLRKINVLVREGRFNVALDFCRIKQLQTGSLVLLEKLGDLYARNDLYEAAGLQYKKVIEQATTPQTAIRVGTRWILILRLIGQSERADQIEADLRQRWKDEPLLGWLSTAQP